MPAPPFWTLKPWWCRPWSIVATGVGLTAGSWMVLHRLWITLPLGLAVLLWWWTFLVAVPAAHAQASGARSQGETQATGCISPPPGVESSSSSP
ncbi:MAG: DUF6737 family protein [Synechococcaceae cyanobacterium]|nr:DUF6737 family protein [Synechococcaceae cyanobacterium]